jgi:NTE family protein
VLCAISERRPDLDIPIHAGVSAGAINTITLAAHPGKFGAAVRGLRKGWSRLTVEDVYRVRVSGLVRGGFRWVGQRLFHRKGPTVVRGIFDMEPLRAFLGQRVRFDQIDENVAADHLRAVTLSAACYSSGETVTFVQGASDIPTWERSQRRGVRTKLNLDHVIASASIPILFPAVQIGGGFYGDGSVRQATPLAPAIHLGADRILGISMRTAWQVKEAPVEATYYPSAAQVMGLLFHSIFLDSLDADAERLERINNILKGVPPGAALAEPLRPIKLLVLRPSLDLGALARPHVRRLPPVIRSLVESIGGQREGASDFISYLLFDPAYTVPMMELGYDDANDQWDKIEEFLDGK